MLGYCFTVKKLKPTVEVHDEHGVIWVSIPRTIEEHIWHRVHGIFMALLVILFVNFVEDPTAVREYIRLAFQVVIRICLPIAVAISAIAVVYKLSLDEGDRPTNSPNKET